MSIFTDSAENSVPNGLTCKFDSYFNPIKVISKMKQCQYVYLII